jgi:hypothetical protein
MVAIDGSLESASWESDGPREHEGVCVLAHRVELIGPPPDGIALPHEEQGVGAASVSADFSEEVWT